ncbi:MAG: septum formation initiator family protein [Nitriliruptor sp.]
MRRVAAAISDVGAGLRELSVGARSGQRPLLVVLVISVVLGVIMLSGPFERYADGRTRVEALHATASALEEENARLDRRAELLTDPTELERLAREEQGMIRPGEVPYTLVPPEVDRPVIAERRGTPADEPTPAWYVRLWTDVRSWF